MLQRKKNPKFENESLLLINLFQLLPDKSSKKAKDTDSSEYEYTDEDNPNSIVTINDDEDLSVVPVSEALPPLDDPQAPKDKTKKKKKDDKSSVCGKDLQEVSIM